MATPFEGGRALGEAIFGGRQKGNSDVFLSRLRENYNTQRAMDEAASSQIQRIAREAITAADIEAARKGDMAAQARLGEAALRTADSPNLRNITAGLGDFDEAGYKRGAVEKARLGDFAGANAELVGLANGPLKVNDIDSGYQINPYDVGGAATPTGLQVEREGTERARQGELGERANLSRVKAAGGGFAPKSPSGGGGGKGGSKGRSASASKAIIGTLEKEMGRKLTADEVDAVYAGEDFNFQAAPLGAAVDAKPVDNERQAEVRQALKDARAAVATGKITKAEARKRLEAAGYKNIAARL